MSVSIYSEALAEELCSRMVEGRSLNSICKDTDMPSFRTVMYWLNPDSKHHKPDLLHNYVRAREVQADTLAYQVLDIADQSSNDHEHTKIMIDARKWMAGKLAPKKYDNRVNHNVSGSNDGDPVKIKVDLSDFSDTLLDLLELEHTKQDEQGA